MSSIFDGMADIFVETFGEDDLIPYTHGATTALLKGIIETPALLVQGLADADIVTADTELHCSAADLPSGYGEGDTVVVRGSTYRTKVPMPDGRGMVRIPLFKI